MNFKANRWLECQQNSDWNVLMIWNLPSRHKGLKTRTNATNNIWWDFGASHKFSLQIYYHYWEVGVQYINDALQWHGWIEYSVGWNLISKFQQDLKYSWLIWILSVHQMTMNRRSWIAEKGASRRAFETETFILKLHSKLSLSENMAATHYLQCMNILHHNFNVNIYLWYFIGKLWSHMSVR